MSVRFATKEEIQNWNMLITSNPDGGNVFASYEFAIQKETGDYKAIFLIVDKLAVTVLEKNSYVLGKLWYLPKGPGTTSVEDLVGTLKQMKKLAIENGVFVIRIESELDLKYGVELDKIGLIKSRPIIPNPSTITLDISPKLDDILTSLPQKGRYAIRRAEREGVDIKLVPSSNENCRKMYKLLSETAEGQFGIRNYEYYRTFWQRFEAAGLGQMFLAYYKGDIVAGAYAMVYGQKSTYKDGASIRKRQVYGASHLLQWHIIKWAKEHDSRLHDLCGSPPSDKIDDVNHKHHGIGLFKTAFNKTVTDYIGCYDYVINPLRHKLWIKLGEKIAIRLHYYKHHDSYF